MKTPIHTLLVLAVLTPFFALAQVGVGTVTPNAQLDIKATNQATPANTDGILIPKIDEFPLTSPTVSQDGMMVFATGAGTVSKGFYYWDQTATSWTAFTTGSAKNDAWFEESTTTNPNDINDDIYTLGYVSIGKNTASYLLDIESSTGGRGVNTNIQGSGASTQLGMFNTVGTTGSGYSIGVRNEVTSSGTGSRIGVINAIYGAGSGPGMVSGVYNDIQSNDDIEHVGTRNVMAGTGSGIKNGTFNQMLSYGTGDNYGVRNLFEGNGDGLLNGVYNSFTGDGDGIHYGTRNNLNGVGNGVQYGTRSEIPNTGTGNHYGSYNFLSGAGTGIHYGTYNHIISSGSSLRYGTFNAITGAGTGEQRAIGNSISNSSNSTHTGVRNQLSGVGSGSHIGLWNLLSGTGSGLQVGVDTRIYNSGNANHNAIYSELSGSGTGQHNGVYSSLSGTGSGIQRGTVNSISNTGNGIHYGTLNGLAGSGSGVKYGSYNMIQASAGGTHYGLYAEALKAGSYAGYFKGRVSIGTTNANEYILPSSRGSANQLMQTDGSGNVSWASVEEATSASNGLSLSALDVRLGGSLSQNTTINYGSYNMTHNLNGTGDFVIQDAGANHFEVRDNGGIHMGGDTFWFDEDTSGTVLARLSDTFNHGIFQIFNAGTFQHTLHGAGTTIFNETGGDYNLRIESDTNTNMFFVDAGNNRIGIGTPSPGYTLDVNGDINTSGNIRQSGGAYSFPDYVFETYFEGYSEYNSSYTVKPLHEVERFLKKHKHLPGVQNRSDVAAKGWNLSENVRTNLEKIEELYLYAIEANKTIVSQQKQIDELKALVQKLIVE